MRERKNGSGIAQNDSIAGLFEGPIKKGDRPDLEAAVKAVRGLVNNLRNSGDKQAEVVPAIINLEGEREPIIMLPVRFRKKNFPCESAPRSRGVFVAIMPRGEMQFGYTTSMGWRILKDTSQDAPQNGRTITIARRLSGFVCFARHAPHSIPEVKSGRRAKGHAAFPV